MKLYDQDGRLNEDVQDALYELGNVGVGMASITIGKLLEVRVELKSPKVVPVEEVSEQLLLGHIGQDQVGIWMRFAQLMNGSVLFILDRLFLYDVVEQMTGRRCEGTQMYTDEVVFSALTEFANILSAAYMKAVGKYTGMRIYMSPYLLVLDRACISFQDGLPGQLPSAEQAIWVETSFQLLKEDGEKVHDIGRVVMLADDATVEMLMEALGM